MESSSGQLDYRDVVVNKPWGYEYLMYENSCVSVWQMSIRHEQRTSMHCHPAKKTGIVLLSGEARVSFLNDSIVIRPLAKLMIREGLFHSTAALSPEGVVVIETETPSSKTNLVRLDDAYGREEKPYEGGEAISSWNENCLRLQETQQGRKNQYLHHGSLLTMEKLAESTELIQKPPGEVVVVLEGGLFSRSGDPVLSPGDVISSETLGRLAERFSAPRGISLLTIRKEAKG